MMQMDFTIRYDSGEKKFEGLEHYYGSQSLFGISQVLLISLNAFFNREILTQAPSAHGFKVIMGRSKLGSWEQLLQLVVTDPNVLQSAAELGKDAVIDLLKWALGAGLGLPFVLSKRKARKRVRELERENDDLQEKLDDALRRAHAPVKHQGLTVYVMAGRTNLATFDQYTLQYLETEVLSDETQRMKFAISRFNTRTGTGRLISTMDAVSTPFFPFDRLTPKETAALADNLALVARDTFKPIELIVSSVTDAAGRIKRYKLHSVL
jgi:hypothetical protein